MCARLLPADLQLEVIELIQLVLDVTEIGLEDQAVRNLIADLILIRHNRDKRKVETHLVRVLRLAGICIPLLEAGIQAYCVTNRVDDIIRRNMQTLRDLDILTADFASLTDLCTDDYRAVRYEAVHIIMGNAFH